MDKWKVIIVMLTGLVLAGCASAVTPLIFDDFETYVVGQEGTLENGDLWLNWWEHGVEDDGNPFLTPRVDNVIKYEGNNSMRLDAPLMDHNSSGYFISDASWGVQLRNDTTTWDANNYNIMTAMVRTDATSSVSFVDFVLRDVYGNDVGDSGSISVPNDGNWYKIKVVLDISDGEKSEISDLLPFFDIAPNAPSGVAQLWIDDIRFEHTIAVNEILSVDINSPIVNAGGKENYLFVMTGQPPADVNFTLFPPETLDFGAGFGLPVVVTFTTSNWNIAQALDVNIAFTAAGIQTVDVNASSSDPNYNAALPGSFEVQMLGPYSALYVISPNTPAWQDVPDDTGIDLSNGLVGEIWLDEFGMFTDADWVEWAPDQNNNPPYAEIVFDFGNAKNVSSIDIWHSAADYYPPGNFKISYSTNGTTYTTPKSYTPYVLSMRRAKTRIDVNPAVNARYVKLKVECVDNNSGNWFFLSEVLFNAPKVTTYPVYTYDPNNIPSDTSAIRRDPYLNKLMNGAVDYYTTNVSFQYLDLVWFDNNTGAAYDNVYIYADYGKIKEFSNLSLNYVSDACSSSSKKLWAPSQVNLSFSDDGVTYGTPVSLTSWYQGTTTAATYGVTDTKTFAPKTGRYAKIHIVRNTANAQCLRFGEIILSNRPQMTYILSTTTPVWGGTGDQPGDPAYYTSGSGIANLNFGDLADGYIPTQVGPYNDSDWVEWAPDQVAGQPAYGLVTFDLKSVQKVKNVAIAYCSDYADMPSPGGLEAAFSTDGTNFSAMTDVGAVFSNELDVPHIYNTVFALPETQARYVQLKIHCRDDDPGNWIFISEVKFNVFAADFDDSGAVNFEDLATLCGQWLQTGSDLTADIAGDDEQVNFLDFAEFATEWLY